MSTIPVETFMYHWVLWLYSFGVCETNIYVLLHVSSTTVRFLHSWTVSWPRSSVKETYVICNTDMSYVKEISIMGQRDLQHRHMYVYAMLRLFHGDVHLSVMSRRPLWLAVESKRVSFIVLYYIWRGVIGLYSIWPYVMAICSRSVFHVIWNMPCHRSVFHMAICNGHM